MRRRGLDVVARPKPEKDTVPHWLAFKGPEQINIRPRTPDEHVYDAYRREIAVNSDPVGTRYIIYLKWNAEKGGWGHVIIAEKTADGILTIDPQNGEIRTSEKDNRAFMDGAENTRMNYQRIDNAGIVRRADRDELQFLAVERTVAEVFILAAELWYFLDCFFEGDHGYGLSINSVNHNNAPKIHDERGKTWHNLGPGSIAKNSGGKVGDKFIEQTIADNADVLGLKPGTSIFRSVNPGLTEITTTELKRIQKKNRKPPKNRGFRAFYWCD